MSLDRKVIEEQLAAIGETERWWDSAEVRELPTILSGDERILALANGRLKKRFGRGGKWLCVVTTHRLVCLRSPDRLGRRQLEIPITQLTSLAQSTRILRAVITVITPQHKYRISVKKADALRFVGALSAMVNRIGARSGSVEPMPFVAPSELMRVYDRIEMMEDEIARLREQVDFMEKLLGPRLTEVPLIESATRAGVNGYSSPQNGG